MAFYGIKTGLQGFIRKTVGGRPRPWLGRGGRLAPFKKDDKTRFETFLLCADNSVVSVEINCHFMGGGEAGQILASCRALDHRKKVETAIGRRTDNYREILDESPDGFLLMTPKGKIIETNDAYAKLVGYTKDEILQMNYYQLVIGKNGEANQNGILENSLFNNYHKTKAGDYGKNISGRTEYNRRNDI
ncbi:MAG: PAS domain S-box protein [Leptospirales bacterium]